MNYFIGIDVGTGSARAGLFDETGKLLANHSQNIQAWRPEPNFVEQSSENIWQSICTCIQAVIEESGIAAADVKGIGFDATCSLVLIDENGKPVTASPSGEDNQNVVVWMDHRALRETETINNLGASGGGCR